MIYRLYKTSTGEDAAIRFNEDGSTTCFFFDPDNSDYAEYLRWLSEGNQPTPAEEQGA